MLEAREAEVIGLKRSAAAGTAASCAVPEHAADSCADRAVPSGAEDGSLPSLSWRLTENQASAAQTLQGTGARD